MGMHAVENYVFRDFGSHPLWQHVVANGQMDET
jgi:hypothetical protein